MSAMLNRLKRIEAGRYQSAVLIVPPAHALTDTGHVPTEQERTALTAKLEAMSRNPKAIIIIRQGPRLDAWRLPAHLLAGREIQRSYAASQ